MLLEQTLLLLIASATQYTSPYNTTPYPPELLHETATIAIQTAQSYTLNWESWKIYRSASTTRIPPEHTGYRTDTTHIQPQTKRPQKQQKNHRPSISTGVNKSIIHAIQNCILPARAEDKQSTFMTTNEILYLLSKKYPNLFSKYTKNTMDKLPQKMNKPLKKNR